MEACELVRLLLNKITVPEEPKRAGNPGYGIKTATRILIYARLKGLQNDTRIIWHLKRHPNYAKTLGLHSLPDRTTIGRWWKRYLPIIEKIMHKLADIIQQLVPTTHLIVDSTPLKDLHGMEAKWGFSSRGPFKGYKLHVAVNQYGLPLNATVTTGNLYDSKLLPQLIEDLETPFVVADAGYDTLDNTEAVKAIGATPIIATNPRRKGKAGKVSNEEFFGGMRYPVEQLNGHIKDNVLRNCWVRPHGLMKKSAMVWAALVCVEVVAIWGLLCDDVGLKCASKYWD
jgi:IS5 family transposase